MGNREFKFEFSFQPEIRVVDVYFSLSRASVLPQFGSAENGGATVTVSPNYAEIIVIRHGETEWNADRRIQVLFVSLCWLISLVFWL